MLNIMDAKYKGFTVPPPNPPPLPRHLLLPPLPPSPTQPGTWSTKQMWSYMTPNVLTETRCH